jgi:hypothetical protein
MTKATIRVPGLKVTVPLAPDALPRDLIPMDGPAGEPIIDLVLDGADLTARARLNGRNYVTVRAESPKGFDKSKLQNGVLEPLREADLID